MGLHDIRFVAMHGADGQGAGARQGAGLSKGLIPGGGLRIEGLADLFGDLFQFLHGLFLS